MNGKRERSQHIKQFIIDTVAANPTQVAKLTSERFALSKQAVNRHLHRLIADGILEADSGQRARRYRLKPLVNWSHTYALDGKLEEDTVWRTDAAPRLETLNPNVYRIWQFGFTEMLNNAIEHSHGSSVTIRIDRNAARSQVAIIDDGEGIFRKIKKALNLPDERLALIELGKGKLTTDPKNHTGEGIFFTSRAFDTFQIASHNLLYSHHTETDYLEDFDSTVAGTLVRMELANDSRRSLTELFDYYAPPDGENDYGFTKTTVPLRLAQFGDELLMSRSQARRVLDRIDHFKTVVFDFTGVTEIGQAFADQIFRVFATDHPEVDVSYVGAIPVVERVVKRAIAAKVKEQGLHPAKDN